MRKICEWSKCKEIAYGQGLIKKDINKQYKWFCGDHLKIHNKTNDNSCDWKRCKQPGEFKAPSKTAGEYKWFCSEHIKIYNHEWDFFSEMSQDKIEEFIHSDITWHKPTSKLGSKDNFFNKVWRNILEEQDIFPADYFKQFDLNTARWSTTGGLKPNGNHCETRYGTTTAFRSSLCLASSRIALDLT